jgi:hypothetical protein
VKKVKYAVAAQLRYMVIYLEGFVQMGQVPLNSYPGFFPVDRVNKVGYTYVNIKSGEKVFTIEEVD